MNDVMCFRTARTAVLANLVSSTDSSNRGRAGMIWIKSISNTPLQIITVALSAATPLEVLRMPSSQFGMLIKRFPTFEYCHSIVVVVKKYPQRVPPRCLVVFPMFVLLFHSIPVGYHSCFESPVMRLMRLRSRGMSPYGCQRLTVIVVFEIPDISVLG